MQDQPIFNPFAANDGLAGHWLTPGRFAALLAALIFAAYPEVILGRETFVFRDFGNFAYPLAFYQRECFWRGEWPLWNPLNNCGMPFLAQWNTMTLYPLSLFYLLLPLSWSLAVFCLLHLFLGGMGMYFLAARWSRHRLAAAVAGVAFAFNGLSLNSLMWTNNSAALGWMPWVVLLVDQAWRQGGRRTLLAGMAGALQMLTGAPEIILMTWLLLAAMWLVEFRRGPVYFGRWAWRFGAVVLWVAGLCAAQLLPFLDLLAHSQRDQSFTDASWPMPGWGWANLLVPLFYNSTQYHGVKFQYDQGWTSSSYLGIGALALALFAAWRVRERRVYLLAAASGLALILALGGQVPLYGWLRQVLPPLAWVRFPIKFVTLTMFVVPLLAAYAIAWLQIDETPSGKSDRQRLCVLWLGLLALIGVIVWFAKAYPQYDPPYSDWPATLRSGLSRGIFLSAILSILLGLRSTTRPFLKSTLGLLLVLLAWADVLTHAPRQNPTVSPAVYEPGLNRFSSPINAGMGRAMISPDAKAFLYTEATDSISTNYVRNRLALNGNLNLLDNVAKVDGFFSLDLREYDRVARLLYARRSAEWPALMDFLSVSQFTERGKYFTWSARTNFLPLATAGQKPVFASQPEILNALTNAIFDPRRIVYLEPEAKSFIQATSGSVAHVSLKKFSAQLLELQVDASAPAIVVVAQTFYHPWHAYVDGQAVPLWRANYAFQAIEVPAGQRSVRLVYEDRAWQFGVIISVVSLVGWVASWLLPRRGNVSSN